MQLQQAIGRVFAQLSAALDQLSAAEYTQSCNSLLGNTIGQHVRHIIELFQCLERGYEGGKVNYELRKRDPLIENDKELAIQLLLEIYQQLHKDNIDLQLEANYEETESPEKMTMPTNYYREMAYNLEHTIHHMALIRTGINDVSRISVPENFGVAISTMKYRKQCAP
jgi:uncharacterized damage-inducible protein DinB